MARSLQKISIVILLILSMLIAPLSSLAATQSTFQSFSLLSKSGGTLVFQWPSITGATALNIEQKVSGGDWTEAELDSGPLAPTDVTATITGLTAYTNYTFRLDIVGGQYEGYSNELVVAIAAIPVADLTFGDVGASQLELKWTAPENATNVIVQQSTNNSTWSNSIVATFLSSASSEAVVTGLVGNTKYYFRLYVVGGSNAGYSNVVTTTTGTEPNARRWR
ncbi:fibronectin type III domain-containing protein [Cohnella fermenti]|uniref:Fibronectin type III domain-containing protein n=1 Tax=Cohnella fermenti TaxID=2565925 RepID=A0A4S4C583_9BACL|nr:fibronectin type III domain-containing protein [Cohnella fermenti]THF80861.1 fibronectin type III domain-containing protein [Cohnella fermenti]